MKKELIILQMDSPRSDYKSFRNVIATLSEECNVNFLVVGKSCKVYREKNISTKKLKEIKKLFENEYKK